MQSLPIVDWNDLQQDRSKFLNDLNHALSSIGFLVLTNVPGFEDDVQQRMFKEVRSFFSAPDPLKAKADISLTPYFRGWNKVDEKLLGPGKIPRIAQEAFQYGFENEPVADPSDKSVEIYKRLFRGPNTMPDTKDFPNFKPCIDELCMKYHKLTHDLGHLICESFGFDSKRFEELFPFDDPDLAASLNHNFGVTRMDSASREKVAIEYAKLQSNKTGAHIDGPPFVALLINDKPGLQVVAGEGKWISAPVTCQTAQQQEYPVPVIPGAVIVNSGGTLMHLSKGKVAATLHRVNPLLVPDGDSRISMPYFLIPKMDGPLIPFEDDASSQSRSNYNQDRDRGNNAAVNRMGTFPQCTRVWWASEYKALREKQQAEVEAETKAAFDLAAERARRNTDAPRAAL